MKLKFIGVQSLKVRLCSGLLRLCDLMPPAGLSARGLSTLMDPGQPDARLRNERYLIFNENGSTQANNTNVGNYSPRYQHTSRINNQSFGYAKIFKFTIILPLQNISLFPLISSICIFHNNDRD